MTPFSLHKDLGVNFSDNLSWRLHYQTITSKAYKSLGLLLWNAKCDKNNANNNIIKGKNKNRFLRSKIDFPKSSIEV